MIARSNSSQAPRLRVLLSAFACSPGKGSEPGVGWNVATRLANFHDVTVLYGDVRSGHPSRHTVESWISENGAIHGLNFVYVPPTRRMLFWERLHRIPGLWFTYYRAYSLWQWEAFKVAASLHRMDAFDLSHLLTFVSFRDPGYLWQLNIPFFWGPIGGVENVPLPFWPRLALEEHGRTVTRDILNRLHPFFAVRSRIAARKASLVWGASRADMRLIHEKWSAVGEHLLETGTVPRKRLADVSHKTQKLRLIWSGHHVARKALPILLEALHLLGRNDEWSLVILGQGPCTHKWRAIANRLSLHSDRLQWLGHLPHEQAVKAFLDADVLVHTSVKEGSTSVIMEALSLGRPVICHDIGGMSFAINPSCGLKIPLVNPQRSVEGFRHAINALMNNSDLLCRLSAGAVCRAHDLSWSNIAKTISQAYTSHLACKY